MPDQNAHVCIAITLKHDILVACNPCNKNSKLLNFCCHQIIKVNYEFCVLLHVDRPLTA